MNFLTAAGGVTCYTGTMRDLYDTAGDYGVWTDPSTLNEATNDGFALLNRRIVEKVLEVCTISGTEPDQPLLELGSGMGALGRMMPKPFHGSYIQTDRTPAYAGLSRDRNPHLATLAADAARLPFADRSVGTVIAMNLFDVLDDAEAAAHEIRRVLVPGSNLIHLHDRRPMVGCVAAALRRSMAETGREVAVLPVTAGHTVTNLQLVEQDDLEHALSGMETGLGAQIRRIAGDVGELDRLRQESPDDLAAVGSAAGSIPGIRSPGISALFAAQTRQLLERAGFSRVSGGTIQAAVTVSRRYLDHLYPPDFLRLWRGLRPAVRRNVLIKDPDGHYYLEGIDTSIPSGQIRQEGAFNVLVATA